MDYPHDLSPFRPLSADEMLAAIQSAVLLEIRCLKSAKWRKNTDLEELLREYGVNAFAQRIAEHLIRASKALYQGPEMRGHKTAGGFRSPAV
jgi:hypothetical protein